jgi:hypothetical protein
MVLGVLCLDIYELLITVLDIVLQHPAYNRLFFWQADSQPEAVISVCSRIHSRNFGQVQRTHCKPPLLSMHTLNPQAKNKTQQIVQSIEKRENYLSIRMHANVKCQIDKWMCG